MPERCPHCYREHGSESCTTCHTYRRYFPRLSPHFHPHAYHARPRFKESSLKVLKQPAYKNKRQIKRYLMSNEDYGR